MSKNFKKALSVMLAVLILMSAMPITGVAISTPTDDTLSPTLPISGTAGSAVQQCSDPCCALHGEFPCEEYDAAPAPELCACADCACDAECDALSDAYSCNCDDCACDSECGTNSDFEQASAVRTRPQIRKNYRKLHEVNEQTDGGFLHDGGSFSGSEPAEPMAACECTTLCRGTYAAKQELTIYKNHALFTNGAAYDTKIPKGALFTVTMGKGTLVHVLYNGIEGYAQKLDSTMVKVNTCNCSSTSRKGTYVAKNSFEFYPVHSTWAKLVDAVPSAGLFEVITDNGTWVRISYNNKVGCALWSEINAEKDTCNCSSSNYSGTYKAKSNIKVFPVHSTHTYSTDTLETGKVFTVVKGCDSWAHVTYKKGSATYTGIAYMGSAKAEQVCTFSTELAGRYQTTTNAIIYALPSVWSDKQDSPLRQDTEFTVDKLGDGWAHIKYENITGYVRSSQIRPVVIPCNCSTSWAGTCKPKSQSVKIYSDHYKYAVRGEINSGNTFTVTKCDGTFAHVVYNGIVGCVLMNEIEIVESCNCSQNDAGLYRTKGSAVPFLFKHNTDYITSTSIPANTLITVIKSDGTFAHVKYKNGTSDIYGIVSCQGIMPELVNCSCKQRLAGIYKTTADHVIIYSDHNQTAERGEIPVKNAEVKVSKSDGTWAHVNYNGTTGCVPMSKLQPVAEDCSCDVGEESGPYTTKPNVDIPIYSMHSTSSPIRGYVKKGDTFTVTKYGTPVGAHHWAHVIYFDGADTIEGYATMNYMTFTPPCTCETNCNETWIACSQSVPIYSQHTDKSNTGKSITKGETFTVVKYGSKWAHIRYYKDGEIIEGIVLVSKIARVGNNTLYPVNGTVYGVAKGPVSIYPIQSQYSNAKVVMPKGAVFRVLEHNGTWHEGYWEDVWHEGYWENGNWACVSYFDDQSKEYIDGFVQISNYASNNVLLLPACTCNRQDYNYAGRFIAKGKKVKVYSAHSELSAIIGEIPKYKTFYVEKSDAHWAHVHFDSEDGRIEGLVRKEDIAKLETFNPIPADDAEYLKTKNDNTPLYAETSVYAEVLSRIPKGCIFKVTKANSKWARVTYAGKVGFIQMNLLIPQSIVNDCFCTDDYAGTYTALNRIEKITVYTRHSLWTALDGTGIPAGKTFEVTSGDGVWAHVNYNNGEVVGLARMSEMQKLPQSSPSNIYPHDENGLRILDYSGTYKYNVGASGKTKTVDVPYRIVTVMPITQVTIDSENPEDYVNYDFAPLTYGGGVTFNPPTEPGNSQPVKWIELLGEASLVFVPLGSGEAAVIFGAFALLSDVYDLVRHGLGLLAPDPDDDNVRIQEDTKKVALISGRKIICYVWVKWNDAWYLAQRSECVTGEITTICEMEYYDGTEWNPIHQTMNWKYKYGDCSFDLKTCIERIANNYVYPDYLYIIPECNLEMGAIEPIIFDEFCVLNTHSDRTRPPLMTSYGVDDFDDGCPVYEFDEFGTYYYPYQRTPSHD